jgi:hypothetical protein
MGLENTNNSGSKTFLKIIGGKFAQTVKEDTPNAVEREYEDTEGNMKTKFELYYDKLSGVVTSMKFEESQFGDIFVLTIEDTESTYEVRLSENSSFYKGFARRLKNINLNEELSLKPYSFIPKDSEKTKKGMNVFQGDVKIADYYYTWDSDKNEGTAINGLPEVDEAKLKKMKKKYWDIYYAEELVFLRDEVEDVLSGWTPTTVEKITTPSVPQPDSEQSDDDLPF